MKRKKSFIVIILSVILLTSCFLSDDLIKATEPNHSYAASDPVWP